MYRDAMKKPRKAPKKIGNEFWNKEYGAPANFALSLNPSEDLQKFVRFLEREHGRVYLNPIASVLDLGCGNGRNLMYLAKNYNMRGVGYDISKEAIDQAKEASRDMRIEYDVRSVAEPLPLPDKSQTIVLDMMVSHVLNKNEREQLREETARVLKPGGWLFLKTFLRDEDRHAERLLREHPAEEMGSYVHPEIGVVEHVFTEDELREELEKNFFIHKVYTSHRHLIRGKAAKRRSISIYAQRV